MFTIEEWEVLAGIAFATMIVFGYLQRAKNRDHDFKLGTDMKKAEDIVGLFFVIALAGSVLFGSLLYIFGVDVRIGFSIGAGIGLFTASRIRKTKLQEKASGE